MRTTGRLPFALVVAGALAGPGAAAAPPAGETLEAFAAAFRKARAEVLRTPLRERVARAERKLGPVLDRIAGLGTPEALAFLRRALDREPDPIPLVAARAIARVKGAGAVEALLQGIGRRPPKLKARILEALVAAGRKPGASLGAVRALLADPDANVRVQAALLLGLDGSEEAIAALVRAAERGRDPAGIIAALEALARSASPRAGRALLELSRGRSPIVKRAAIRLLGERKGDEAFARILEALREEDRGVRAAALRALHGYRRKEMVGALIALLGREDGKLQGEALKLLVRITRQNMGLAAEDWKNWWTYARDRFTFKPEEEGKTAVRIRDLDYYGIEIFSKRLTFIIDCSSSMRQKVRGEKATRVELAKRELIETLKKLRPGTRLNIISFNTTYRPMSRRGLVPIDGPGRRKAIQYVEKLPTGVGTNIYDTLSAALQDPNVDTIFFLSDGLPTRGRIRDPDAIREAIRRENLARNVTIHTIALGVKDDRGFLEKLAAENGGSYVYVEQ